MTFTSDPTSLQSRVVPDWFRDGKFGIWSHWGPQSVPRQGDWYARRMYIEGEKQYRHHLETYGHPSQVGYKDIIPLWKAEKFDPHALMEMYVNAGAKYFVSMGVHHDNFDLWNSRHQRWNAVNMGPRRDIVGEWQAAARQHGLPFGVSEHLGASYSWLGSSHGADQNGPRGGVPYDGQNPEFADLYHASPPFPSPAEIKQATRPQNWYASEPQWARHWSLRMHDLVDRYQPDLLYSDGGLPFDEIGRELVAHLFNRGGSVYNHKKNGAGGFFPELSVPDVERGSTAEISAQPWQCDTSIGDWYYCEDYPYKTTAQIIHLLADVVAKNGSLLLNVVQYPDGSLPPEARQFLVEMAQWMAINGEAIYGTRPWQRFGEGPTSMEAGHFKETFPFTARDVRFTTKENSIYALTLGVPQGETRIESLGKSGAPAREIGRVELLGSDQPLKWTQRNDALWIEAPAQAIQHAAAFKITLSH